MFIHWSMFLVTVSMIFGMFLLIFFYKNFMIIVEYFLCSINNVDYKLYFLFDWISILFSMIVLLISSMVMLYSNSYMKNDKNKFSFCWIVLLFVFSMILLILMPNMFMIVLGWDGLGLVSYCLVIHYQSINSYNSGMMTIISNRVGDVMIVLSMIFFVSFGSFDFFSNLEIELICGILILVAGLTKSAQIPFSAWLPAAMAAPTPVSSLVHSSTLVTAGVYILMRFSYLFEFNIFSTTLLKISLLTMMMAGINAFFEIDFKKIIAFSTLSQLSMMMIIMSIGYMEMAFLHLVMHAIFKSMLFLCAGFVIHSFQGIQDIRMLGNFLKFSPFISSCFMISILSLVGFPFIGGFYSKDLIVEFFFFKNNNLFMIAIFLAGIMSTFFYCLRITYVLLIKGNLNLSITSPHFEPFMFVPIFVLSMIVLVSGNFVLWITIPNFSLIYVNLVLKNLTIIMMMLAVFMFIILMLNYKNKKFLNLDFFFKIWFLDVMTSMVMTMFFKNFLKFSFSDWTWMECLGPKMFKSSFSMIFLTNLWIEIKSLSQILFLIVVLVLMSM
uniref:NADH dehydrogenase subunit 5 n=1 Tax=Amblyomma parvum TaxID=251391 RepID=UPI002E77BFA7|nr:NADH dehydrogenase subunit 5 [Amblyomma parvum]WQF69064.1 NADH dehydrogenase subunit 5 [Amblyomma parvum]